MTRRKTLTDNMVAKLKPGPKRITLPDPEFIGHYVRITPAGAKSYVAVAREPYVKKQVWATIGSTEHYSIEEARNLAREAIKRIKAGLSAFEPPPAKPDSFKAVAEKHLKRHVRANRLRSEKQIERILNKYVYPVWGDREFESIRRSDVAVLLDMVQDAHGPRQADYVLAIVRGIMRWHASRSDDYVVPIGPRMTRADPKTRKRARILDDGEIRAVWAVAAADGAFGAILRLALLTAQRREKIAALRWEDVTVDGVWNIPTEEREKGNAGTLVLPEAALAIIQEQTRIGDNVYVFAGRRAGHFNGFSPCKRAFDKKVGNLPRWTLHDLRRSARSLMSRAGVRPDIAERVMGHAITGVEGVYDRHSYRDEKADALQRLANLIEGIVHPPTGTNVVPLKADAQ